MLLSNYNVSFAVCTPDITLSLIEDIAELDTEVSAWFLQAIVVVE